MNKYFLYFYVDVINDQCHISDVVSANKGFAGNVLGPVFILYRLICFQIKQTSVMIPMESKID